MLCVHTLIMDVRDSNERDYEDLPTLDGLDGKAPSQPNALEGLYYRFCWVELRKISLDVVDNFIRGMFLKVTIHYIWRTDCYHSHGLRIPKIEKHAGHRSVQSTVSASGELSQPHCGLGKYAQAVFATLAGIASVFLCFLIACLITKAIPGKIAG